MFSIAAQERLKSARNVNAIPGRVRDPRVVGGVVELTLEHGKRQVTKVRKYDRVIVALGFDPWLMLNFLPPQFRPQNSDPDYLKEFYKKIELGVDRNLCLNFDYVPEMKGVNFNVHVPAVAALAQGPGFPSLCCLGHLSDRILSRYIEPPKKKR